MDRNWLNIFQQAYVAELAKMQADSATAKAVEAAPPAPSVPPVEQPKQPEKQQAKIIPGNYDELPEGATSSWRAEQPKVQIPEALKPAQKKDVSAIPSALRR